MIQAMKVVIVAHDFPPSTSPGAVRPSLLAEGLAAHGFDVLVVTAEARAESDDYAVASVPYQRMGSMMRKSVGMAAEDNAAEIAASRGAFAESLTRFVARSAESLLMHPDKQSRWIEACDAWASRHRDMLAGTGFIVGMALPLSSAVIADRFAGASGARFVLDVRDLWTDSRYYPYGSLRKRRDRAVERQLLERANSVVVVTQHFSDVLLKRSVRLPLSVIYNGVPSGDWSPAATSEHPDSLFRIGFFGSTYGGRRDLRPVLRALRSLADAAQIERRRVRIDLYGDVDPRARGAIDELALADMASWHGTVSRESAAAALGETHVALVPMWPEDIDALPYKALEYLAAGRTLLVTGARPESEVALDLHDMPGVAFATTAAQIGDALLASWESWIGGNTLFWSTMERTNPYTAETMVHRYVDLLRATALSTA